MDLNNFKALLDIGLGPLAFAALMFGGWKVWKFMDLMVNNHLSHIQTAIEEVSGNTKEMSESMSDLAEALKTLAKK